MKYKKSQSKTQSSEQAIFHFSFSFSQTLFFGDHPEMKARLLHGKNLVDDNFVIIF
jgi:hypothetical protein